MFPVAKALILNNQRLQCQASAIDRNSQDVMRPGTVQQSGPLNGRTINFVPLKNARRFIVDKFA